MYALIKAAIFELYGGDCAVCAGDRNCKVNRGRATDLHHELVPRSTVMQWPEWRKEQIDDQHNCAPVCSKVNTGAVGYPNWHDKVRRQMMLTLGRHAIGFDVSDVEAIKHGKRLMQEWIDGLQLRTNVSLRYDGDDELTRGAGDGSDSGTQSDVEGAR